MATTRQQTLAVRTILRDEGFDKELEKITQSVRDNKLEYENAAAKAKVYGNESDVLGAKQEHLSKKIEAQKEKVEILNRALDKAKDQYGENSEVTKTFANRCKKTETQLYRYEEQLKDTEEALEKAAKAEDKAGDEATKMGDGLSSTGEQTSGLIGKVEEFATSSQIHFAIAAAGAALLVQGVELLVEIIKEATDYAREVENLSQTVGMTVEKYQEWDYVFKQFDSSMEEASGDLAALGEKAMDAAAGAGEGADLFEKLGVEVIGNNGAMKDQEQIIDEVIVALRGMGDETERNATASALLGTTGEKLVPILNMTAEEVTGLKEEANELGIVLDRVYVAALAKLDRKTEQTAAMIKTQARVTAAALAPTAGSINELGQSLVNTNEETNQLTNSMSNANMYTGAWTQETFKAIDTLQTQQIALYASGRSVDDFNTKLEELTKYLINQGMPAEEANAEALALMAEGYDTVSYATEKAEEAQGGFDAAINAALESYQTKSNEYLAAIETRSNQFLNEMGGIFGAFPAKLDQSEEDLKTVADRMLEDVQNTNTGFKEWSEGLEKLAERGVDEGLIAKMEEAGPKMAEEIKALNSMSDEELQLWVETSKENAVMFRNQAVSELEPLKAEVDAELQKVEDAIAAKEEGMKEVGRMLGAGVVDGVEEEISGLTSTVVSEVESAIAAAKAATHKAETGGSITPNIGPSYSLVPSYGTGTIATRPHLAVVGDEEEVIVPLNNNPRSHKLLDHANEKMGRGGKTINITNNINISGANIGDPKVFARAIVKEIDYEIGMLES